MQQAPLTGLRVLELGSLIAGPVVGKTLAEFGAEVIKIETPDSPDPLRTWGAHLAEGRGSFWPVMARGKKCITLNLRAEKGQHLFRQLVQKADVVVENFRPGTLERWGIGPAQLHAVNPRLIITRVSGYGQTGPYAGRVGFASAGEAMSGLRHINGYPDQPPPRLGVSLGDTLAGMFGVQGTLMALHARDAHGVGGQVVDASILESCFAMLEGSVTEYDRLGIVKGPSGRALKGIAPSNIYQSREGRWIVIAANTENLFRRLCAVIGQPALADDPRFRTHEDRGRHAGELDEIIGRWAGEHTAAEIDRLLNDAGVVCGPIYTVADCFTDPHFAAREMLIRMHDAELGDLVAPGITPKLSATPGRVQWPGPAVGAHNREIYEGLLHLPADQVEALTQEGII